VCKQELCYDTVQLCGMTVEADDTSDLPYPIFVLPQVNELRLADRHRPVGLMSAGHYRPGMWTCAIPGNL
jgi:hypothetical protein